MFTEELPDGKNGLAVTQCAVEDQRLFVIGGREADVVPAHGLQGVGLD